MPKSVNNIFRSKIKFRKMYEAYVRAAKNKHSTKEVIIFDMDLGSNLISILKDIYYGRYRLGKYRSFIVYIPKIREVKALPFRDRVMHQWYVEEFIKPVFLPKFIKDTYACLKDRGSHKAVFSLQRYMRLFYKINSDYYILKCDISKFFYTIDKVVLLKIISRHIKDKEFLSFTRMLLYDNNPSSTGIPIGNYTSQFFANIYLNELDHYVNEKLRVKYYIRYMDDFILLLDTKQDAIEVKNKIEVFLKDRLHLTFNQKTNYFKNKQGVSFCGYRIFRNKIFLRSSNKKRIYKTIKEWKREYLKGTLDCKKTCRTLNSWKGYAGHARCKNLMTSIYQKCEWIYDKI